MDQTVVEESLRDRETVMKEGLVSLDQLGLIGLVVEALGVEVSGDELGCFLLLVLIDVSLLQCLSIGSNQASISHVLFGDVKFEAKLLVAEPQEAEESDSLDIS
jgi:hypothetical protein